MYRLTVVYDEPADNEAFDRRYTDAFKASVATPEMAATRKHADGCGTTYTTYAGDVAEV